MAAISAGLLMCRIIDGRLEFLMVHPGGPYFASKNEGSWAIPKGLVETGEPLLAAAQREFLEETGLSPVEPFHSLAHIKMKSGKIVHAWSFIGEWNGVTPVVSNKTMIEWPPRSGKKIQIPEIDKAAWMDFEKASTMIIPSLQPFLARAVTVYK